MAKEEQIEMEGVVVDTLPNTMFRVELGQWTQGHRPHLRQDAQELHPHPHRRPRQSRTDALRPSPRAGSPFANANATPPGMAERERHAVRGRRRRAQALAWRGSISKAKSPSSSVTVHDAPHRRQGRPNRMSLRKLALDPLLDQPLHRPCPPSSRVVAFPCEPFASGPRPRPAPPSWHPTAPATR